MKRWTWAFVGAIGIGAAVTAKPSWANTGPAWISTISTEAAAVDSDCAERFATSGILQASRVPGKRCIVQVTRTTTGPISRSYLISSNGVFMVFNQFGNSGSLSRDTGARTYFLFPRIAAPDFEALENGFAVSAASGAQVRFSGVTGMIESMEGIDVVEDPVVSDLNRGGVELRPRAGLILDAGWKVGAVAYADAKGKSAFLTAAGRCEVTNSEIFDYTAPLDPALKFATDEPLRDFLHARCPDLGQF